MLIMENKLRSLCRTSEGAQEAMKFQEALNKSTADPVPVQFESLDETKTFNIPRQECEFYAQIAKEEAAQEFEVLKYINPGMHLWVRNNRIKMCEKLRDAMLTYEEQPKIPSQGIVIMWPLFMPDQVPLEMAQAYVRKYGI